MRIQRASASILRRVRVLFIALFVPVVLRVIVVPFGLAAEPEPRPAKKINYPDLMLDLISPNELPVIKTGQFANVKFSADYDRAAQRKIHDVRQTLHDNFEESLPYLIAALDDERYCMTINWADGERYYNESVGAICRDIIASQLEVYRDKIEFSGPRHWHKFDYSPISREWWEARRDRKLFELQVEAVEWAIKQFETETEKKSDPSADRKKQRADRKKQLSDLRALRDSIVKDRKPAKSVGMFRMHTRDVGKIQ